MIPRFLDLFDLDFFLLALRYTLGEHDALDARDAALREKRGAGIIIGGGVQLRHLRHRPGAGRQVQLPRRRRPSELDRARRSRRSCKRHGVPLPAAALQFPLHHPIVASVIPGGFKPEHVKANIGYMRHEIPDALWAELKQREA